MAKRPTRTTKPTTKPVETPKPTKRVDVLTALKKAGFKPGITENDGVTFAAIRIFQKLNNLPNTGELDDATLKKLNEYA